VLGYLAVVHLLVAAVWLGSMSYSLFVVQPRVAAHFTDPQRREEFLTVLAQGNRWRVVGLVSVLVVSAAILVGAARGAVRWGFTGAMLLDLSAAAIFVNVSWRHWPARIFALAEEVPRYQRSLRLQARGMLVLVGLAFVVGLTVSVRNGVR
jgi:hypothetical protein